MKRRSRSSTSPSPSRAALRIVDPCGSWQAASSRLSASGQYRVIETVEAVVAREVLATVRLGAAEVVLPLGHIAGWLQQQAAIKCALP